MMIAALIIAALTAPTLSPESSHESFESWMKAASLIEKSDFSAAAAELERWPHDKIQYELQGDIPDYAKDADKAACELFSRESEGKVQFERGSGAAIRIELVDDVMDPSEAPKREGDQVSARIGLRVGVDKNPISARTLSRKIARVFGFALGMGLSNTPGAVMGTDTPLALSGQLMMSQAEHDCLTRLLQVRAYLSDLIANKKSAKAEIPKLVVSKTALDAGIVQENEKPYYEFEIENTGNAILELRPEFSCRCLSLTALTPLKPGEKRTVRIALFTTGLFGNIDKSLTLHCNDPENPAQEVRFRARIVPQFRVLPDVFERIGLNDQGTTDVDMFMYSTPGNAVKLMSADVNAPKIKLAIEGYNGEIFDPMFDKAPVKRVGYRIRATFEPDFPAGEREVWVLLHTDSAITPTRSVTFHVQKGLVAYPKYAYFGSVPAGIRASRTVSITHPNKKFKIVSAQVESGPFEVSFEPSGTSGTAYKLTITFVGKERGVLSGKIKVTTDCPGYETVTIEMMGNAV